jgi:capsule polysaccharide export protein KpsE/RkpR
MAQKRQLDMNKEARLMIAEKKIQANNKTLQKAQQTLEKYQATTTIGGILSDRCFPKQRWNFS